MLNLLLAQNGEYRLAIGGVVDVIAGKKGVDKFLHFIVAEHLTVWDSGVAGKAESQCAVYVLADT